MSTEGNSNSRAELYRQSMVVDENIPNTNISDIPNSPIWDAAVRSKSARIPHLMSPGSPSQSSENLSSESISSSPPPRPPMSEVTPIVPTTQQSEQVEEMTEEIFETETSHNNEDDIEQGHSPSVSFEEDAPPAMMPVTPSPTTRPNRPSLTINTRDTWEEHPGKKTKSETYTLETPSTVATTPTSPSDSVYTIEHKHTYKKSKKSKAIAFSKPVIGIAGVVAVALTGGGAFLLSEFLTIPGLNAQIEELTRQVDRLEAQVDRLEGENDRFEELNDRLEQENSVFAAEIIKFNNTNALYAELNVELAELTDDNERLNYMLNASNVRYEELNEELAQTKDSLNEHVEALSVENDKLSGTVAAYTEQNKVLTGQVDRLEVINDDMAVQMKSLNNSVANLSRENDRLSQLNDDLRVIVNFLDETAGSLTESYDDVAKFLSNQITAGRSIWTTTTKNIYRARTNNMVCDIQSRFSGQPFVLDATLPIGEANYPEVMSYVDEHFLSELCLKKDDFESFLANSVGIEASVMQSSVALSDLVKAMMRFNVMVMDYYFPRNSSQAGTSSALNMTDWSGAKYQCENLPLEKRFVWPVITQQPKSDTP